MRVLKTMNTVNEITKEDLIGLNINNITQHHRRSDKVYQIYVVLCIKRKPYHF
jgi:hypothetical protein